MYRVNVRRALLMTALMLLLPTTQANVSDWRGPDAVKPTQDGSEFTAFRVPTNATVLDSWVEISNDENAMVVGPLTVESGVTLTVEGDLRIL